MIFLSVLLTSCTIQRRFRINDITGTSTDTPMQEANSDAADSVQSPSAIDSLPPSPTHEPLALLQLSSAQCTGDEDTGKHGERSVQAGTPSTSSRTPAETVSNTPTILQSSSTPGARLDPVVSMIIPDEDPTRPVVQSASGEDGEDAYNEYVLDGLGQDDEEPDDDDNPDPEEVRPGETASATPLRGKHCCARPTWLMEAFNSRVAESKQRGLDKLPALYWQGTFWFPQKSSFFLLRRLNPAPQTQYNPRFFLWDPLPLVPSGIACPRCHNALTRHLHVRLPRRVVDLERPFWIIGYIYRCTSCTNPKTGKKGTVTFRSWDSRVLGALPPELRAEFPARLSWRSGISLRLYHLMRSCIQSGMGAKQFSDAVRVQHLRKHDLTHLQYLHYLHGWRRVAEWPAGQQFAPFLPFDDISLDGYHGFIPSSQWFRDMYDRGVEEHMADIDQHTAMLSGEICAIDHSHKVCKYQSSTDTVLYSYIFRFADHKARL